MKESLTVVKLSFCRYSDLLNSANYFFFVNNASIATPKSANVFFLTANQRTANPPIPATAAEPVTMPAIAPPESPSFLAGGVISPPPEGISSYTAVRVFLPIL